MCANCCCHQSEGHFHRRHHGDACSPHGPGESKDMRLARLKAALLVLQARVTEIQKHIKHMEECEKTCE